MIPLTDLLTRYGSALAAIAAYLWAVDLLRILIFRRLRHRIEFTGWRPPFILFKDENSLFIFLLLSGAAVGSALGIGKFAASLIQGHQADQVRIFGGTAAVFLVAAWLFRMKINHLRWYALLEMSFALVATEEVMRKLKDTIQPVEALSLLTSAYLLIRGMDNFKKDLDERKKKTTNSDQQRHSYTRLIITKLKLER